MQFELTKALIDSILFSMEDQGGEYLLDTVKGAVCGRDDIPEVSGGEGDDESGVRYIPLPEWDSASGFSLMELFAARFKNPIIRKELTSALALGRGVFRAFKDTLGRYPEAEKFWFSFKKNEMKREILMCYNGLREEWGLEKIGAEPEETGDLVLEDFRFRQYRQEDMDSKIGMLHCLCLDEYRASLAENGAGFSTGAVVNEVQAFLSLPRAEPSSSFDCLIAESGDGEFAGFISGITKDSVLYIQCLEVKAEYRGLGIGETLLNKFLESMDPDKVHQVLMDLPSCAEGFSRVLLRESFKPYSVRYWLNLRDR